jgi:ribosomal protein L11 methylase PrmA
VEIAVRRFELGRQPLPWLDGADVPAGSIAVVANLLAPLLLELARCLHRPPANLIAGGLLKEQVVEIVEAFSEGPGLRERERRQSGEWAAVWLTAP